MSKEKMYTLDFINKGKPFKLSKWTVEKQEQALSETSKFEDDLSEKELDRKYRSIVIIIGLKEVDPSVSEDNLKGMHPDDIIELFAAVYLSGKKGITVKDKDFREKKLTNLRS